MNESKRASLAYRVPVQGCGLWWLPIGDPRRSYAMAKKPGTVEWSEHQRAWFVYASRHGFGQSAERIEERGGFGYGELCDLLGHPPTTWQPCR